MALTLQNFLLFQLGWFACVLGGASSYPWAGTVVVLLIIAVHLGMARSFRPELVLILSAVAIGATWDSLLTTAGVLQFSTGLFAEGLAPHWMIAMWALFATTLNVSLKWLKQHLVIGSVLGLVGGPLAYYAGHRLGAVEFGDLFTAMLVIGVGWAVIMPVLLFLATYTDGYQSRYEEVTI